jgi:membrane protein
MAEGSPGLVDKVKARIKVLRQRYRLLDHVIETNEHYGSVQGSVLAGAVTYFGFLSFFPILALGFSVVGYISFAYPDAKDSLTTAIEQVLPGIVSADGAGHTISLQDIESSKRAAGIVGFLGLLYTGLGWVSGLRTALQGAFRVPRYWQGSFIVGKLTDVLVLAILGAVMIMSVGITGAVKGWAGTILGWVGLDTSPVGAPLIWSIEILLGLATGTLLLFVMFKVLGRPTLPAKPLVYGALLGAVGFELLKLLAVNILGSVGGSALAPLAIAITLIVWINYFSRLVLYGASWAMTSSTGDIRPRPLDRSEAAVAVADLADPKSRLPVSAVATATGDVSPRGRFDAGSAMLGAVAGAVMASVWGRSSR